MKRRELGRSLIDLGDTLQGIGIYIFWKLETEEAKKRIREFDTDNLQKLLHDSLDDNFEEEES